MGYPIEIKENYATAAANYSPVSMKKSILIAKRINGMPLYKAKNFLNGLLEETVSIEGKYHTKAAAAMLGVVESAEANAKQKELSERLRIKTVTVENAPTRLRRKRLGARRIKWCHVKVILEDIDYKKPDKKKADDKKQEEKVEPTKSESTVKTETKKAESKETKKTEGKKPEVKEKADADSKEEKE